MKEQKIMILLEYTDIAPRFGPLFEAVEFDIEWFVWGSQDTDSFWREIFPEIESRKPDVVVFFLSPGYYWKQYAVEEPQEWLEACQRIRESSTLQHTKIAAFLGLHESTVEQQATWHERYDFYTQGPLKVIEHSRIIRHLVGEDIKGFEGVNYYLLSSGGSWKIQDYFLNGQSDKKVLEPDARGQFSESCQIKTRLLAGVEKNDCVWGKCIQTDVPTYIVYIIKTLKAWQEERLSAVEAKRLSLLADQTSSGYQLLIGANKALLNADPEAINEVVEQAHQVGAWQVFINEHLWFENVCPLSDFEPIVYQGIEVDPWVWPVTI